MDNLDFYKYVRGRLRKGDHRTGLSSLCSNPSSSNSTSRTNQTNFFCPPKLNLNAGGGQEEETKNNQPTSQCFHLNKKMNKIVYHNYLSFSYDEFLLAHWLHLGHWRRTQRIFLQPQSLNPV